MITGPHGEKVAICKPMRAASGETKPADLGLGPLASRMVRRQFSLVRAIQSAAFYQDSSSEPTQAPSQKQVFTIQRQREKIKQTIII